MTDTSIEQDFCKCYDIANRQDMKNPDRKGAFTGVVSERIAYHISALEAKNEELENKYKELEKEYDGLRGEILTVANGDKLLPDAHSNLRIISAYIKLLKEKNEGLKLRLEKIKNKLLHHTARWDLEEEQMRKKREGWYLEYDAVCNALNFWTDLSRPLTVSESEGTVRSSKSSND